MEMAHFDDLDTRTSPVDSLIAVKIKRKQIQDLRLLIHLARTYVTGLNKQKKSWNVC